MDANDDDDDGAYTRLYAPWPSGSMRTRTRRISRKMMPSSRHSSDMNIETAT